MRFLIYLITVSIPLAWGSLSLAGFDNGNAGDIYASEFILTGRDVVQRLDRLFKGDTQIFDTAKLHSAIETTTVVSEPTVMLDGFEKDAKNKPAERWIDLSQTKWRELRNPANTVQRLRLVLHEYLFITGVDDTNFPVSEKLMQLLNVGNYSPGTWWNPVNPVNFVLPTLDYAPSGCTIAPANLDTKNSDETVTLETKGDCKDAYRKVVIVKSAGVIPPSSNAQGLFHRFEISVFDDVNHLIGGTKYSPPWNIGPLQTPDGTYSSGQVYAGGGVEIEFRYLNK